MIKQQHRLFIFILYLFGISLATALVFLLNDKNLTNLFNQSPISEITTQAKDALDCNFQADQDQVDLLAILTNQPQSDNVCLFVGCNSFF